MSQRREVVLHTETTGRDAAAGHRIIEIGCVELRPNRFLQIYINREHSVDEEAVLVHGLDDKFLADKLKFAAVAREVWQFIQGAELIIHNAEFDLSFLHAEFRRLPEFKDLVIQQHCSVIDTLRLARQLHPGQRNSLDALCKRYKIDARDRKLHGAHLDATLLARVYLAITSNQMNLFDDANTHAETNVKQATTNIFIERINLRQPLRVIQANVEELLAHQKFMEKFST